MTTKNKDNSSAGLNEKFNSIPFFLMDKHENVVFASAPLKKFFNEDSIPFPIKLQEFIELWAVGENGILEDCLLNIRDDAEFLLESDKGIFHLLPRKLKDSTDKMVMVFQEDLTIDMTLEYRRNQKLLHIINDIFHDIVENSNMDVFLDKIVQKLYESDFPYYHVAIFLVDDSGEYIYLASIAGENRDFYVDNFPDGYFQATDVGILGRAFISGEVQIVPDVTTDPDYYFFDGIRTVSEIAIPISSRNKVVGVINIESKHKYQPSESELAMLENISQYLGMAISNKMLVYELAQKQDEMEKFIVELQEAKERIENQTFDIIESMEEIEAARKYIEEQHQRMKNELDIAGDLLKKLLPDIHEINKLDLAVWFEPSASLGGDFYDIKKESDDQILFIQVDVTGHGVSSALLAAMSKIAFQNAAEYFKKPALLLESLNTEFQNLNQTDLFFSAFVGLLDTKKMVLHYSNGSHPYPILVRGDETIELDTDGFLVGVMPEMSFENKTIQLQQGDKIFVYTDGLVEAKNKDDVQFGIEGLKSFLIQNHRNMNLDDLLSHLVQKAKDFSDGNIDDDITILGFEIK